MANNIGVKKASRSKEKGPRKSDVEWTKIRTRFITENLRSDRTTPYTLHDVAKDYNLQHGTVRNRSAKEKWRDELIDAVREKAEIDIKAVKEATSFDEAEVRHRQSQYARMAQARAVMRLQALDPSELSIREAIDLLKLGMNEERSALGLPNEYIAESESDNLESPMAKAERYSRLKGLGDQLEAFIARKVASENEPKS